MIALWIADGVRADRRDLFRPTSRPKWSDEHKWSSVHISDQYDIPERFCRYKRKWN